MKVSIRLIRDADQAIIDEAIADITLKGDMGRAFDDMLSRARSAMKDFDLNKVTVKFDKA
jgi:hypothetical protein